MYMHGWYVVATMGDGRDSTDSQSPEAPLKWIERRTRVFGSPFSRTL
jgi:hypothetical protein